MSYVRLDDQHENGRLTQFRERLSGEIRMQTGEAFEIFQDRNDIAWGQQWKDRIEESLDAVTFLIPIITPAFFKSPPCRDELARFLKREQRLGRTDLILPVYYVECALLSDEAKREQDEFAKAIAARQYADWRELRFEPFTSPQVGRTLAKMAQQIVDALERSHPAPSRPPATAPAAKKGGAPQSAGAAGQSSEDARPESGTAARGPSAKTEPPILVVDALHRGDYLTLTDALRAAKPGTRILVRPGLYKEGVLIDKPVEIIGDGERGDIVIEAAGKHVIEFRADMGRIANLTLRQAGGDGTWYCVDIAQGRLDLQDCDISSQSSACVGIHDGADPRLRRNRIHNGKQSGVYVYDNGQGTLEDNEIFANTLSGVEIKTDGNPILRRNRIHDGKGSGVCVHENGQGTLEDDEIFANTLSGVEIRNGGNPFLRRNRIHDGKACGVYVHENGRGTIEDNEIFANTYAGVEIRTGGTPTLRRNRITNNLYEAIWVEKDGGGVFEENDLRGNKRGAWDLAPEAKSRVKRSGNIE